MALLSGIGSETLYVAPEGNSEASMNCLIAAGVYLLFFIGCIIWKRSSDEIIVRS